MARPPSKGIWTNLYGPRINPVTGLSEVHHGLDIGHNEGTLLVAPEAGTLTGWGVVPGWGIHGNVAIIAGADGWVHWLSHTDRLAEGRKIGDRIAEGDPIAVMGLTGQTTGLHVHWETRHNGLRLNPVDWLAQAAGTDPEPFPEPVIILEDNTMTEKAPLAYVKGDKNDRVYAVYVTAGANNDAAKTQGGVYCARRAVGAGEFRIAQAEGYTLRVIPQAELDGIPKVYGSK